MFAKFSSCQAPTFLPVTFISSPLSLSHEVYNLLHIVETLYLLLPIAFRPFFDESMSLWGTSGMAVSWELRDLPRFVS
jgi:hypothetical protein